MKVLLLVLILLVSPIPAFQAGIAWVRPHVTRPLPIPPERDGSGREGPWLRTPISPTARPVLRR